MLTVTEAANAASSHLKKLFPSAEKMLLEEVELSDDDQYWLITLSFFDPSYEATMAPIQNILGNPRLYRIVKLNSASGEVRSVKIRERQYA
jgi:hypothetical protein